MASVSADVRSAARTTDVSPSPGTSARIVRFVSWRVFTCVRGLLRLRHHFITATLEALLDLSAMRTIPLALHPSKGLDLESATCFQRTRLMSENGITPPEA